MTAENSALAKTVGRAEMWKRMAISLTLLLSVIVIGFLAVILVEIRQSQVNGTPVGRAILETSEDIRSCTTPEGECYQQNEERTRFAIDSVNEITIYAVTCAQQDPDAMAAEVRKCVERLYLENHPKEERLP